MTSLDMGSPAQESLDAIYCIPHTNLEAVDRFGIPDSKITAHFIPSHFINTQVMFSHFCFMIYRELGIG